MVDDGLAMSFSCCKSDLVGVVGCSTILLRRLTPPTITNDS